LVFVAHHLIFDVVSWRVFLEDVLADYLTGKPAGRGFSIAAWAHHLCHTIEQGDWNHEIGYWTEAAAQVRKTVGVRERPTSGSGWRRRVFTASLDAAQTATLEAAQQTHDFRIPEVLLAALSLAWNEVFREASLPLSMEGHGREADGIDSRDETIDLSRSIGWFTSQFPVVLTLQSVRSPAEALEGVRHQLRAIPRRGLGFGLLRWLHDDPSVREQLALDSFAMVGFNYLGSLEAAMPALGGFRISPLSAGEEQDSEEIPAHWLEVNARIQNGLLEVSFAAAEPTPAEEGEIPIVSRFAHYLGALLDSLASADGQSRLRSTVAGKFAGFTLDEASLAAIHADLEEFQL